MSVADHALTRPSILSAIEAEITALRGAPMISTACDAGRWLAVLEEVAAEYRRPPMLWCCHIRGPDDVIACDGYETALKMSDELNIVAERINAQWPEDQRVRYSAVPAPWPWTAESHAESLKQHAQAEQKGKPA